jgi:GNAT superfamily N-acetyltransferase
MVETIRPVETETWRVRLYREEDRPSLLRLAALHYTGKEPGNPEYIDWLYSDAPAGRPTVIVGEDIKSGEIVGYIWNLPYRMKVGAEVYRCNMCCNGLVHPDFRRSAIYATILKTAVKASEEGITLYGFPKQVALFRLQGAGFKSVMPVPLLIRPLDIGRLVQKRLTNPLVRLGVDLGWRVVGNTVLRQRGGNIDRWNVKITDVDRFDEGFDNFWSRVADKYEVAVTRDRTFLNWRFRGASFRPYPTIVARADGEIVGYAVLRCTEVEGIRSGMIADFMVEPGERGDAAGLALVKEATRRLKAMGMYLAGSLMLPHTQEYRILRQAGYVEAPNRVAPQKFRIMATQFLEGAYKGGTPPGDRWFVTMADHDAI